MSLASELSRQEFNCIGGVEYTIPFYFLEDTDLTIYREDAAGAVTTLVLTADYSVEGAGDPAGGTLTTVATYSDGKLIAVRDVPYTQELDLVDGDGFRPDTLERVLDRGVMQSQQLQRRVDRSFALADSDTSGASTVLPSPEAGKTIRWSSDGLALENANPDELATLVQASNFTFDRYVDGVDFESGVTVALTLTSTPGTDTNTQVFFDGVYQSKALYILENKTLTFDTPIIANIVEVVTILAVTQGTAIINDGAVTESKIASGAVTADKIGTLAVTESKISGSAVSAAKIATDAVETAKVKDSAITAAKIAASAIETAKIKDQSVTSPKLSLTVLSDVLSADILMTTAGDFYSGLSVDLSGRATWLLMGVLNVVNTSASNCKFTGKLWDGVSVQADASAEVYSINSQPDQMTFFAIVNPVNLTTYYLSCTATFSSASAVKMLAAAPDNGAGNNASYLIAIRIG